MDYLLSSGIFFESL